MKVVTLMTAKQRFCEAGRVVVQTEMDAISGLLARIDDDFAKACEYLMACSGRIVVIGMGKSGHIAGKIAATLASTGSPAFFVHPGEANHGDFGMITAKDVVLALSNSGNTAEILTLIPLIKHLGVPLITLTGRADSPMAQAATVNIDVGVPKEACPLGLAPTASTTAALVIGDALAIALLEARGFTVEDFAFAHPGGNLGRRLLLRIDEIMRRNEAVPRVLPDTPLNKALVEMSQKRLGMTAVVDADNHLVGVFTDGDLRRSMDAGIDIYNTPISERMTKNSKTIKLGMLAAEALDIMETHKITTLLVTDQQNCAIGIVHLHDLLSAGVN